ncbi:lysine-specific demethylase JMJ21 [Aristolochia californica]|uniref:lysine-specific demethylase JMJ21 n=1 Tax=Aristolochia californica TaxID=171875 RepID=UPI0035DF3759
MENPQPIQRDRRPDALGDLRVLPDELLSAILEYLSARDVARLSCVSSVMYILCNEEPLWMTLCLKSVGGLLEYKSSWKETTLYRQQVSNYEESSRKHLHFDGFNSFFLYRRWYRCFISLDAFSFNNGYLERRKDISMEDFYREYDAKKPVLLTQLADTWPARATWTTDQLLEKYGDTPFKISQRSRKKITMKFKDYVTYMNIQHDEDPLYIFDDKFGEAAPGLLEDYRVPHMFQEDLFDVLDKDQRPPFRWLIIGPERSGASWHVDPALTSAWNTLLSGRKRWALYPPGKVPLGVMLHVNEDDGDVNIESPSSLQWWLDFYPLLADEDKPIECTQLPGETIFVPSGWWHCVLNLETTIAVTQNFVNTSNFEFVCLDMTPGYRHKGISRAGLLALYDNENLKNMSACDINQTDNDNDNECQKEKRPRLSGLQVDRNNEDLKFSYEINFLSKFLDENRDHYNCNWSSSNSLGQREMRQWLHKLWVEKPEMRGLIWKGACLALNVEHWSACLSHICAFHDLPSPPDDEKFPVGTGSNPVYLIGDYVIKIYVEDGLECSILSLGCELEFYDVISEVKSPLRNHIPDILGSGIVICENGSYKIIPWNSKGVPDLITKYDLSLGLSLMDGFHPLGVWRKNQFVLRNVGNLQRSNGSSDRSECAKIWPYVITKRCKGDIFANLREKLSKDELLNLAAFLGDQLRTLHLLPLPSLSSPGGTHPESSSYKAVSGTVSIPDEWVLFVKTMAGRRKDVLTRLSQWGDPIPNILIEKVEQYIPDDPALLLDLFKDKDGYYRVNRSPAWIHSDIMDDNIHMESCIGSDCLHENTMETCALVNGDRDGHISSRTKWCPSHILDFSDLTIGDPLCDVIPIYLDVFRGERKLLEWFLESYRLPLVQRQTPRDTIYDSPIENEKLARISFRAMCYCILHDENILGSIFSLWRELRSAVSWEEVEETVWGILNKYQSEG